MGKTTIEWSDETWNPLVGCAHVSAGCDNCYAARFAMRGLADYKGLAINPVDRGSPRFTGEIRFRPKKVNDPLHWTRPRRVFVNSMSDLFHQDVPLSFLQQIWDVMIRCPQHTFQVLTKRPQQMRKMIGNDGMWGPLWTTEQGAPPRNVWLGTSIEDDRYCFRADHLRNTGAAVRWLSLEPLLGPLPSLDLTGIDWVVAGGESGPNARPMHPDWVRDIRDRCAAAGIPFLFKQWGEWAPLDVSMWPEYGRWVNVDGKTRGSIIHPSDVLMSRFGKHLAGRTLDGRTWDEYPDVH